jgi:hypothetical protein
VGNDLILMPGAMVALQRNDGQVLLTKRADDGTWCLPAGAAEVGGSFARTAIAEPLENEDPSDRLLDVETQLGWLRELGFDDVDCYWKWLEMALLIGVKPAENR